MRPYAKTGEFDDGLALIVPVNGTKPDFVVIADQYHLSIRASFWFKLRAAIDNEWGIKRLRDFATKQGASGKMTILDGNRHLIQQK
ncbi:hypothetical protein D3C76_26080 [compost metagenome]